MVMDTCWVYGLIGMARSRAVIKVAKRFAPPTALSNPSTPNIHTFTPFLVNNAFRHRIAMYLLASDWTLRDMPRAAAR